MYPHFSYLALDKNKRYTHNIDEATIKTKKSEIMPVIKILEISRKPKLEEVIG
jgi:hypothetical protein